MRCATDLSLRAGSVGLSARASGAPLAYKPIVGGRAGEGTWRIIDAVSRVGLPFALALRWSSGDASGMGADITVGRAARICVHAQSVDCQVANLANVANDVVIGIADGFDATRNVWQEDGSSQGGIVNNLNIPPFARRVRLELSDPTLLATTQISMVDGLDLVRGLTVADAQPDGGIPCGGTKKIQFATTANTAFRLVFDLSL